MELDYLYSRMRNFLDDEGLLVSVVLEKYYDHQGIFVRVLPDFSVPYQRPENVWHQQTNVYQTSTSRPDLIKDFARDSLGRSSPSPEPEDVSNFGVDDVEADQVNADSDSCEPSLALVQKANGEETFATEFLNWQKNLEKYDQSSCVKCRIMFNTKEEYILHNFEVHQKHIDNSNCCFKCKRIFDTKDEYEMHNYEIHQNKVPKRMTSVKGTHFSKLPLSKRPKGSRGPAPGRLCRGPNHPKNIRKEKTSWKCRECSLEFPSVEEHRKHRWAMHNKFIIEKGNFKCDLCHVRKKTQLQLNNHMRYNHGDGTGIKCQQCDFVTTQTVYLHRHVRKVHSGQTKVWRCDLCDIEFKKQEYFKFHQESVHLSLKKNVCPHCDRAFIWPRELERHMNKKFKPTCDICGVTCCSAVLLKTHLEENHPNDEHHIPKNPGLNKYKKAEPLALKEAQFQCEICEKPFKDEQTLNNHVQKGKRFYCINCNKCFCQMKSLQDHLEECDNANEDSE